MLWIKYLAVFLIFMSMFLLGYHRRKIDYLFAQKFESKQNFSYSKEKYPNSIKPIIENMATNYKWMSSFTISFVFCVLSLAVVIILFGVRPFQISAVLYLLIFSAIIITISIGNMLRSYALGYGLAQNIKKVIQSPVITLFLIIYFWKIKGKPTK